MAESSELSSQNVNIEETLSTRPETMLGLAVKYFLRHKLAVTGLVIVLLLVIGCIVGPNISPYDVEKSCYRTDCNTKCYCNEHGE